MVLQMPQSVLLLALGWLLHPATFLEKEGKDGQAIHSTFGAAPGPS